MYARFFFINPSFNLKPMIMQIIARTHQVLSGVLVAVRILKIFMIRQLVIDASERRLGGRARWYFMVQMLGGAESCNKYTLNLVVFKGLLVFFCLIFIRGDNFEIHQVQISFQINEMNIILGQNLSLREKILWLWGSR